MRRTPGDPSGRSAVAGNPVFSRQAFKCPAPIVTPLNASRSCHYYRDGGQRENPEHIVADANATENGPTPLPRAMPGRTAVCPPATGSALSRSADLQRFYEKIKINLHVFSSMIHEIGNRFVNIGCYEDGHAVSTPLRCSRGVFLHTLLGVVFPTHARSVSTDRFWNRVFFTS